MFRCTALALVISCWSLSASAQSRVGGEARDEVRGLLASGVAAFDRHDYSSAVALLARASVLTPGPTVGLYLARARAALGQLVEAAAEYRGVLDGAEPSSENPAIVQLVETARAELAQLRPRVPAIEISIGEAERRAHNLRVVLDGRLISVNAPAPTDPGHHEVIARDADGEKARASFEIAEGESKTVSLAWRAEGGRANKDQPFPAAGSSGVRKTLGVVALGVGATGLGVGTVTGIAALSRYSAAEQHCPAGRCTEGAPYPEDGSAFRALRTISAAGFVVGATGIGTWLGLLLSTPPPAAAEHPRVSAWTPVVGMGSAGARYLF